MSKKDYQAIARVLAGDLATCHSEPMRIKVENIARSLADVFAADNPRFRRDTFYRAVGVREAGPCRW